MSLGARRGGYNTPFKYTQDMYKGYSFFYYATVSSLYTTKLADFFLLI